jgi:methionyl-tRNA formyltransferase
MLFKHIEQLFSVNLISFKQDETKTTIAPVITKNDEKIE